MNSRIHVAVISSIAIILLMSGLSCSPGSQNSKIEGVGAIGTDGLSPTAALEVTAVGDAINASTQYALTADDLSELQNAGVVDSGDLATLQPFIKH